jgi:hypothetical protein
MALSPLFVAPADHEHTRRVFSVLERHGVETRYFSGVEMPPELLLPVMRIRVVVCFDSPGNYPGNYLRVLQKSDIAPGNNCGYIVPACATPIKLGQRIAVRQITPQQYREKPFAQAVHTMYRDVTGARIPPELPRKRGASGGGYHLPRDTWRSNGHHAAV